MCLGRYLISHLNVLLLIGRKQIQNDKERLFGMIMENYEEAERLVNANQSATFTEQLTDIKNEMGERLVLSINLGKNLLKYSNKKLEEMRKIVTDSQYEGWCLFCYNY